MQIQVIYEDESIVVLDKPAGVVCNRAQTVREETLQDWWEGRYGQGNYKSQMTNAKSEAPSDEEYFWERSGLVHRLDKETRGVMVMAKTPAAFGELLRQFRERDINKEYLALTHGIWKAPRGEIVLAVGRRRDNRQRMGVREDGRESVTGYVVEQEYRSWEFPRELKVNDRGYSGFSLVRFLPKTGRMHQIRVHARHMGHALVGDSLYAGRKRVREDLKWAGGLMLAANVLELTHPVSGERRKFVSQMEIMNGVADYLRGTMDE